MEYTENPQISYLREEYEKKIKECDWLRTELNEATDRWEVLDRLLTASKNHSIELERKINVLKEKLRISDETITELQEDMEFFNSLPWYERMFHKFDV